MGHQQQDKELDLLAWAARLCDVMTEAGLKPTEGNIFAVMVLGADPRPEEMDEEDAEMWDPAPRGVSLNYDKDAQAWSIHPSMCAMGVATDDIQMRDDYDFSDGVRNEYADDESD